MRLVLLGPPGAGKGTQAVRLAAATGARHIATGDLVRQEIAAGTPLGRTLQGYNDRGELVPDQLIIDLVAPRIAAVPSWILDGFPRDEAQARALDAVLAAHATPVEHVIALRIADEDLVTRMQGRRISGATGKTYNLWSDPPPRDDPGPFVQRADDHPEEIRRRLAVYHQSTEPLLAYYAARGLLRRIDAGGPVAEVAQRLLTALGGPAPAVDLPAGAVAAPSGITSCPAHHGQPPGASDVHP
ncbi:MAG TPA: adenylate kinase [Chloroflexota bacterium]|nr:adenylate kinase [Chloroflexota bacterium]